ncbi:MAG: YIP1 family protein [Thaumarchaeota archaeon]|nr:YIP1 family protein [Nitrososphaerota archaeon]
MSTEIPISNLLKRMKRAMMLQDSLYHEVEHDPVASRQGFYIIALVSGCQAIGRSLESVITGKPFGNIIVTGTLGFIETVVGLALWSYVFYFIGSKVFKATATPQEIWRCTGFARSPGVFFLIPFVGLFVNIWILIAYLKAGKQALDLSTGKTILAALVSALPFLFIQGFFVLFILRLL